MKNILIVSSAIHSPDIIREYVNQNILPNDHYSYVIEYFNEIIPNPLPPDVYAIQDFSNSDEVHQFIRKIKKQNSFDLVLSLDEFSVYIAARLREALDIPGMNCNQARLFRDKICMKARLHNSIVRVPKNYTREDIDHQKVHYPIVAKPRSLAGAVGVRFIHDQQEALQLLQSIDENQVYQDMSETQFLFEEKIQADLFHIDCVVENGNIVFCSISRYIGTPLEYLHGKPLGSCIIPSMDEHWKKFIVDSIKIFSITHGVFHIEAFRKGTEIPIFLEIGYRCGGSFIVELIKEMYRVDLIACHLRLQLGLQPLLPANMHSSLCGGWVIFPKHHHEHQKLFVSAVTLPAQSVRSTMVYSYQPVIGQSASGPFFTHRDGLGAFVFIGQGQEVISDIALFIKEYHVTTTDQNSNPNKEIVLSVNSVYKRYPLKEASHSLSDYVQSLFKKQSSYYSALNDISLNLYRGECLGLLGPNGAGKSTLIKIMCGIQAVDQGSVTVLGFDPKKRSKKLYRKIGVVFGHKYSSWWDLPLSHSLQMVKVLYGMRDENYRKNLTNVIDALSLQHVIDQPIRSLSLGERVKSELAMNLIFEPEMLFLDEPTLGLDIPSKRSIRELLLYMRRQHQLSIFLTSHDVGDIEGYCDRVILLNKGAITYEGTLHQLINSFEFKHKVIMKFFNEKHFQELLHCIDLMAAQNHPPVYKINHHDLNVTVLCRCDEQMDVIKNFLNRQQVDIAITKPDLEEVLFHQYTKTNEMTL